MPRMLSRLVGSAALLIAFSSLSPPAPANEVDLREFILIETGMSEAEVLYRLGPYDHETVFTDYYEFPIRKRWAYLPTYGRRGWITEITFDSHGRVQQVQRYRP